MELMVDGSTPEGLDQLDGGHAFAARRHLGGPIVESGDPIEFEAKVRLDTPNEVRYFQNGGILQLVLRQLKARRR